MEDMERFLREEREKRIVENTKNLIEKFRPEVEKEGGTISYEIRYGDIYPMVYISGGVSDDLKARINTYASQFYKEGDR